MNGAQSSVTFTVTYSASTNKFTIAGNAQFDLLSSTGDNTSEGIYDLIGISDSVDYSNVTSVVGGTAVGTVYQTQFMLQNYVDAEDNQLSRFPTVNKSASGTTTLLRFGVDEIFEFSFKYITNIQQSASSPIRNNSTGKEDFRAFMQHATQKKPVDFYPDEDDNSVHYRIILDSSAESSDGTGYKLNERFDRGTVGYFDTGVMKFRKVDT